MSVLQIDPPRRPPRLRLVVSRDEPEVAADVGAASTDVTTDLASRNQRVRDVVQLGGPSRRIQRAVLTSALSTGRRIDRDALGVVLAAHQATRADVHRYTCRDVWQLLFVDVVGWCRLRRLAVPTGVPTALRAVIDELDRNGELSTDSDDCAALHRAIDECTGGVDHPDDFRARRQSVASERGQRSKRFPHKH